MKCLFSDGGGINRGSQCVIILNWKLCKPQGLQNLLISYWVHFTFLLYFKPSILQGICPSFYTLWNYHPILTRELRNTKWFVNFICKACKKAEKLDFQQEPCTSGSVCLGPVQHHRLPWTTVSSWLMRIVVTIR